ncbi:MAG: TRAP transporter large permease subunit [Desulfobacteraceae bacterium]|nr:TRAP transporter large permease subunit [Desulfobacteraceae bacterium]
MSHEAWMTLIILIGMFAFLIKTRLPPAAIFMGALTLAITFKLAPAKELLHGFSNTGMLTIGVLYIVASGMYSTGAIGMISDKLIGLPKSIMGAQIKMLPPVAVASAFLNNTPIVAMMIPIIRDLSRTAKLSAKRLYIPLSFASILGGACTLIGTATNLMLAGMVADQLAKNDAGAPAMRAIQMFDPAFVAIPVTIAGLLFIMVFGKWLLPKEKSFEEHVIHEKRHYEAEFTVEKTGHMVGRTLRSAGFTHSVECDLMMVTTEHNQEIALDFDYEMKGGETLTFSCDIDHLPDLWSIFGLLPTNTIQKIESERYTHHLVEAVISPQSSVVGRRISELPIPKSPYKIWLVALSRNGKPVKGRLADTCLEAGDDVVMEVDDAFFHEPLNETEFMLTRRLRGAHLQRTNRAIVASVITVAMITFVTMGYMSMLNAALLASGAMLLTGCMTMKEAANSISYSTLAVMAAAIGLEAAVSGTGLAHTIANILDSLGGGNPFVALAAVFIGAMFMSNFIAHAAAVALMFPIALSMASDMGTSFMPFAVVIMLGASYSFISPTGYQTNLMVYGPGGYKFTDFFIIGIPLTIVVCVLTILLTPIFFSF